MDCGERHECFAGSTFCNDRSGLGTVPALHETHHRQTLSCEGASQQRFEPLRHGILGSLKGRVNLQNAVAQFLREAAQIFGDGWWDTHVGFFLPWGSLSMANKRRI